MLQYMGTRQPPRPYPLPKEGTKCDISAGDLCTLCRTTLWTSQLLDDLKSSTATAPISFQYTYITSAETIRCAAIAGCPWCRGLANGIHGRIYLDSVYDAWAEGSPDDESSDDDEEDDSHDDSSESSQKTEADNRSAAADDHDPAGIWDPNTDHDTLAYPC
jgi:hypothetical protein